ncbi:UNVERIFIED_CONTAM: hypothetical protein RMT77_006131 [Armadillidium vulgare]
MFKCIPSRIVLAFLCATGVMELYMTRTNLSIAIIKMVQIVNLEALQNETLREPYCRRIQNNSFFPFNNVSLSTALLKINNEDEDIPPIAITTTQRGNILSAFFYAYGLSAIMGGRLAERYGTKKIFGFAVLVDVLGNFLIPVASKSNYIFLILIRAVMGLSQGMCYPSLHSLLSKWIPKQEFSRFIGSVYIANSFGSIFTFQFCGIIMSYYGYKFVFYICGLLGLIWLFFWFLLMHETPEIHPRIQTKERIYILENRAQSKAGKVKKIPWLKMFLSPRVWAVNAAHAGNSFGLVFMITQLPLYMNSIIGVNIKANGFLSSLPFLARYLGSNAISWFVNYSMKKSKWTKKTWQRICTAAGHWCTGLCILLVGYVGCNPVATLCLFSLAMFLNGASCPGYLCNHLQIAPNYAGTMLGVSTTFGYYYTTFGPIIVGALTPEETISEWITVYWVIFVSYILCGSLYMIFLSTDIQSWNGEVDPSNNAEEEANESEKLNTEI